MSLKDRLNNPVLKKSINTSAHLISKVLPNFETSPNQLGLVTDFLALHNQDLTKTVFKFCVDNKYLINIILPPTSLSGVLFIVNPIETKKLEELIQDKSTLIHLLRAIETKSNILITGDDGKTALLNAVLAKITTKTITLENSPQLQIEGKNFIKLLKTTDIKNLALSKFKPTTIAIDDCTIEELNYIKQLKTNYIAVMNEKSEKFDLTLEINDYNISIC